MNSSAFYLFALISSLNSWILLAEVADWPCSDYKCKFNENKTCVCTEIKHPDMSYKLSALYEKYYTNFETTGAIKTCNEKYVEDKSIKKMCEVKRDTVRSNVPVTSDKTARVYRNLYCALCNFENDFTYWKWKADKNCRSYIRDPDAPLDTSKCIWENIHPPFHRDTPCPKTITCNNDTEKYFNETSTNLFDDMCFDVCHRMHGYRIINKFSVLDLLFDINKDKLRNKEILCPTNYIFNHYLGKCRKLYNFNRTTENDLPNCTFVELNNTEYYILENQVLFHNATDSFHSQDFYIINNSRVYICHERILNSRVNEGIAYLSDLEFYLSLIGSMVSFLGLTVYFIVYAVLSPLRNLSGQINCSFGVSLFIAQLCFFISILIEPGVDFCYWFAVYMQYSFLASFFWMNVISINVYISICQRAIHHSMVLNKNRSLFLCSLYAWLSPLLIVIPALILDSCDPTSKFAPRYERNSYCWISTELGLLVFFVIPMLTIILVNLIAYIRTAYEICKARSAVKTDSRKQSVLTIIINMKLCSLTGGVWILSYMSATIRVTFIRTTFVFLLSTSGLWVAFCFLCTQTVFNHTKKKIQSVTVSGS